MSWSDSWVLGSKLRIPDLGGRIVRRDRLTGLLDRAVGHRVTLVTGPAGAGKTVACAAWAESVARQQRVAWLTVDETNRDSTRLRADLVAAIGRHAVTNRRSAIARSGHPAGSARLVPLSRASEEGLPDAAMAWLRGEASPVVLVLDDMHLLAGSDAVAVLDRLIQHAPPSLRLVLAGRFAPGLQLAKLRVSGDLTTVTETDLACSADEAEAYLGELGLTSSPARRTALLGYTAGWMTGLRLIALAGDNETAAGHIAADYLRDEILGRQPDEVRAFMLRVSLADELTPELAERMAGRRGALAVLDRLNRENAFVRQVGGEHYRFQPLVRDMLAAELGRQSPELVPGLLGEAAAWHASQGDTVAAARFAAGAGDWTLAARMLAEGGLTALLPERAAELVAALSPLPAQARRADPAIPAALAAGWLCLGDRATAIASLDQAASAMPARPSTTGPATMGPSTTGRATRLWLAALRVVAGAGDRDRTGDRTGADGRGEGAARIGRLLAEEHSAVGATPAEQRALGVLWMVLGSVALYGGDIPGACSALARAERLFTVAGPAAMRDRTAGWRALAEAFGGDLTAADQIIAGLHADGGSPVTCLSRLAAAQCALDRDQLATAARLLDEARSAAFPSVPTEPDPLLFSELIGVRLRLAHGDLLGARQQFDPLSGLPGAAQLGTELALRAGETPHASQRDSPVLHGRILLACGDVAGALAMAEQCLAAPAQQEALRDRIGAMLLATVAHRRLGATQAAADHLEQALLLAEPHCILRTFVEGGTPLSSAISVLIRPESRVASFATLVLQRFAHRPSGASGPPGTAVRLTDSEFAVLRFLPSHLTNQEIADALCLSVNTVKTHLRTAYRKLGVTSRRAAIARGRGAGLLGPEASFTRSG